MGPVHFRFTLLVMLGAIFHFYSILIDYSVSFMLRLICVSTACLCIIKRRYTIMGLVHLHIEKILVSHPSTSVCKGLLFDFSSLFMTCYK